MIRVLNFFCIALAGLSCLALYHVSEQTRVARMELARVNHGIAREHTNMIVLQAEWQRVADPERIQQLAQEKLGVGDTASVQMASLELLPRRGENVTVPAASPLLRTASATAPVHPRDTRLIHASLKIYGR